MPKTPEFGSGRAGILILQQLPISLRVQAWFFQWPSMTSQPHTLPLCPCLTQLFPLVSLLSLPPASHPAALPLYLPFLLLGYQHSGLPQVLQFVTQLSPPPRGLPAYLSTHTHTILTLSSPPSLLFCSPKYMSSLNIPHLGFILFITVFSGMEAS